MSAYQVALQEMRWQRGYQVPVRQWLRFCEYSSDQRFVALYYALEFGLQSGRLPGWERDGYDRYLSRGGQRLSSVQVRSLLARAAQRLVDDLSQAAALRSLQQEFGVRVL